MVTQNGVPFLQPAELVSSVSSASSSRASCYVAAIPTYVGGHMTMGWATDNKLRETPLKTIAERYRKAGRFPTQYWTPEIHKAAFALPRFIAEHVAGVKRPEPAGPRSGALNACAVAVGFGDRAFGGDIRHRRLAGCAALRLPPTSAPAIARNCGLRPDRGVRLRRRGLRSHPAAQAQAWEVVAPGATTWSDGPGYDCSFYSYEQCMQTAAAGPNRAPRYPATTPPRMKGAPVRLQATRPIEPDHAGNGCRAAGFQSCPVEAEHAVGGLDLQLRRAARW